MTAQALFGDLFSLSLFFVPLSVSLTLPHFIFSNVSLLAPRLNDVGEFPRLHRSKVMAPELVKGGLIAGKLELDPGDSTDCENTATSASVGRASLRVAC